MSRITGPLRLQPQDAAALAALHRASLPEAWSETAFAASLDCSDCLGWKLMSDTQLAAALLLRYGAGEAEILTLAVAPDRRRRGLGACLLHTALAWLAGQGIAQVFLELRAGNAAAAGLYRQAGFIEAGRRAGYYPGAQQREDAIVMRHDLHPV